MGYAKNIFNLINTGGYSNKAFLSIFSIKFSVFIYLNKIVMVFYFSINDKI